MNPMKFAPPLLALPLALLPAAALAAPQGEPIVTLDEDFQIELELNDVEAEVADAGGEHGKAIRMTNTKGLPAIRLKDAGPVEAAALGTAPVVTLDYKTDVWNGRWNVRLFAFDKSVSDRTFVLAEGTLEAGGKDDRLLTDGEWHTATATLTTTGDGKKVAEGSRVPLYVMLQATGSGDLPHETFVDNIRIYPGEIDPASLEAPESAKIDIDDDLGASFRDDFTTADARPMPEFEGNVVNVTPGDDLQAALDKAKPGDVLTLAAGTYEGGLTIKNGGTAEKPVVLAAAEPGSVTITNAADGKLTFKKDGDLYAAKLPYRARWAFVGEGHEGRNLFEYPDKQALQKEKAPGRHSKGEVPGPPEGFAYEGGTLYVKLLDDADPNGQVSVHRDVGGDESAATGAYWKAVRDNRMTDGALVVVDAPHVVLHGLRLHMAPQVAVQVNADHVTVADCLITASHTGVDGFLRHVAGKTADGLRIEHTKFTVYPVYQWMRWGREEFEPQEAIWNALYESNLFATAVHYDGRDTRVLNNDFAETFDAVQRHVHERPSDEMPASEFAYNLVRNAADECFEFDSTGDLNVRVHHNVLLDALVPLAISPAQGGGLTIDHNLVYASPEQGLFTSALFKFDAPWRKAWIDTPTKDVLIANNTLANGRAFLYWTGEDHAFEDVAMVNNLMWVRLDQPWRLGGAGFMPMEQNLIAGPSLDSTDLPYVAHAEGSPFEVAVPEKDPKEGGAPPLPMANGSAPSGSGDVNFVLADDSEALGAGLDVPALKRLGDGITDLGAIPADGEWRFPRPGPRWMTGDAFPPLPPSLDPAVAGFGG